MEKLNGYKIANKILTDLKKKIKNIKPKPGLAVILVGKNPASVTYVGLKEKASRTTGIHFEKYLFSSQTKEKEIVKKIEILNHDQKIHGILVQLPLPKSFHKNKIINTIDPKKDVDGFHPKNLVKIINGKPSIIPGVILGILDLIKGTRVILKNKTALILAKSPVFIKPLKKILKNKGLTVTHESKIIKSQTKKADILIVALGQPRAIKTAMVKENSIIIDVGFTRKGKKVIGDVDPKVYKKTSHYTPVPGGVGPLTVAYLLKNTYLLSTKR